MSKPKLRSRFQAATRGNLKAGYAYNPFPRTGPIAESAPFIKSYVSKFCLRHPKLHYEDVLCDAILLAHIALQRFDPKRASFRTLLLHYFKNLGRRTDWLESTLVEATGNLPMEYADFASGRLRPQRKTWWEPEPPTKLIFPRNGSKIAVHVQPLARVKRWTDFGRVKRGYTRAVLRRAIPDIKAILHHERANPGFIRAVIEHTERRQREDNAEAENRKAGNFDTLRLKTKRADIEVSETTPPSINLDNPISKPAELLAEAVRAIQPTLNPIDRAILDWRLGLLAGTDKRRVVDIAAELGITKGTVSKRRQRIDLILKARANIFRE